MPRPEVLVPQWREATWERIRLAEFENGGWYVDKKIACLTVARDVWDMEFEDPPQPDPINMYRMAREDWERIKGGELVMERNGILRAGTYYQVQAITTGEERWAVCVPL